MIAYLAGPFFTPEQIERITTVEGLCAYNGIEYLSPRKFAILKSGATMKERREVFENNLQSIRMSDVVLACIDGLDAGTLWEMGYAHGIEIQVPVVAYSFSGRKMNVMLAQGCRGFLDSYENIEKFLKGSYEGYAGVESGKSWDFNWEVAQQWLKEIY